MNIFATYEYIRNARRIYWPRVTFINQFQFHNYLEGRISLLHGQIWISWWDAATNSNFSVVLKLIEAWNLYNKNMIFMYMTLSTKEHTRLHLIFLFDITVDNGGSQKTERIGNTWPIQSDKRGALKYYKYFLVAIYTLLMYLNHIEDWTISKLRITFNLRGCLSHSVFPNNTHHVYVTRHPQFVTFVRRLLSAITTKKNILFQSNLNQPRSKYYERDRNNYEHVPNNYEHVQNITTAFKCITTALKNTINASSPPPSPSPQESEGAALYRYTGAGIHTCGVLCWNVIKLGCRASSLTTCNEHISHGTLWW